MRHAQLILPACALITAGALLFPAQPAEGYSTIGGNLDYTKRHFRVFNNFTNPGANSNQTPHPNFPGALGAVMAIWKGCVEWGTLHGDGTGDPHQPTGLGSGNSNFEAFFAGETGGTGGSNSNIHSLVSGCNSGVLAYCETPISNGWRIRFCNSWSWNGGPQTNITGTDLQGVACHEYGHALGLGHSNVSGATMYPSISGSGVNARSIAADDIAGVQHIYGTVAATKPRITNVHISGNTAIITGQNFSSTGNTVWFTRNNTSSSSSNPTLTVSNVSSTNGGTQIVVVIPGNADPGHIAVRRNSTTLSSVSNSWPFDPSNAGCDPDVLAYCESSPNSAGSGAILTWTGSTSVSDGNFTLLSYGLPSNTFGIFFYGSTATWATFGNGVLCVSGSTHRLPLLDSGFTGVLNYTVDFQEAPAGSGPGLIEGGSQWHFQTWYRDTPGGGAGFNLSDGLRVIFCP